MAFWLPSEVVSHTADDDAPLLVPVPEYQRADAAFTALATVTWPSTADFGDIAVSRQSADVGETDDAFAEFTLQPAIV